MSVHEATVSEKINNKIRYGRGLWLRDHRNEYNKLISMPHQVLRLRKGKPLQEQAVEFQFTAG